MLQKRLLLAVMSVVCSVSCVLPSTFAVLRAQFGLWSQPVLLFGVPQAAPRLVLDAAPFRGRFGVLSAVPAAGVPLLGN